MEKVEVGTLDENELFEHRGTIYYVRREYIVTKRCLLKPLALRSVIKQFCGVGIVLLTGNLSITLSMSI